MAFYSRWLAAIRRSVRHRVRDPQWQSAAAIHPLGRWAARRQARALFDLSSGFCYSQILVACERLGLFDAQRSFPISVAQLVEQSSFALSPGPVARLLDGAAALKLLERVPEGYELGDLGAALVGNPGARAMVRHNHHLYRDLEDPLALLNAPTAATELKRFWAYASEGGADGADAVREYSELMAASQRFVVEQVLATVPFREYRSVVDLGGGTGAFLKALGNAYPHLSLTLFDLPAVIASVRAASPAASGPEPPFATIAGDLFGELPELTADLLTLVRVLHDHDDDPVQGLLTQLRQRMTKGARLLIAEPLAGRAGAEGSEAYFATYFLAMGQGRLRTRSELADMLRIAGFEVEPAPRTPVPMLVEVLKARA